MRLETSQQLRAAPLTMEQGRDVPVLGTTGLLGPWFMMRDWDTQSLVGSGESRNRQSHLLHPLQVPPITATPQKKA